MKLRPRATGDGSSNAAPVRVLQVKRLPEGTRADPVAERDNTASMGSPGHARQITDVAARTEDTGAVTPVR